MEDGYRIYELICRAITLIDKHTRTKHKEEIKSILRDVLRCL